MLGAFTFVHGCKVSFFTRSYALVLSYSLEQFIPRPLFLSTARDKSKGFSSFRTKLVIKTLVNARLARLRLLIQ